ncbi:MAG: PAS domain-containing protein [Candidatus Dormibacteraeota bacterium]|nr:PAS domain-containing protein [Candidatus Dormibacteraeota bacterium]
MGGLPGQVQAEDVVAQSPVALTVVDAAGLGVLWNPAAERVFGWKAREGGRPSPANSGPRLRG